MKNIFLIILIFLSYLTNAQVIFIPDINFKTKLLQADVNNAIAGYIKIDINDNGEIEENEALLVTNLFLFNSNISNVTGIEYFTNLQYLSLNFNSISNINISSLTKLINFRCDVNNLSSLNLTGLTFLEQLNVSTNYFTSIDLSNSPNLKIFKCDYNQLDSIDFTNNPSLTKLYCKNNNLISINIKNGINHDFSNVNYNDCWKTGNPNLTTICADASEVASVQSFLNSCGSAQTINVTSNCGLSNEEFVSNIAVYPNPFVDKLTIDSSQSLGDYSSITIYNTLGSIVYRNSIAATITEIDLSNLSKGIYIANLTGESKKALLKIIKN